MQFHRKVAKDATCAAKLTKRTLTILYSTMPTWFRNAHATLDAAALAAYGWAGGLSDEEILARLLDLNVARAAAFRAS